jgi:hypothetical protein
MKTQTHITTFLLGLLIFFSGCSLLPPPRPQLEYSVSVDPVLPSGNQEVFYEDPSDTTFVWSKQGLIIKIKFYNDEMLDKRFDPKVSPYTLTGWTDPMKGYTPPLWTAFEVTVINRTRERVELDPTQAVLRMDNGEYYFCRQGVGRLISKDHFFDYSYLKWSGREGNVEFYKNTDRNDIWHRTEYRREKPVRKGRKYTGMLTFPPLPEGVSKFTLEINDFILAYDSAEAGFGNPTEFTDIHFDFNVAQGVVLVGGDTE